MLGINDAVAEDIYSRTPQTFKALQNLVVAMDDFQNKFGKKTWFCSDNSPEAYTRLPTNIARAINAMRADGVISAKTPAEDIHKLLKAQLDGFFETFPTFTTARIFSDVSFAEKSFMGIIKEYIDMR